MVLLLEMLPREGLRRDLNCGIGMMYSAAAAVVVVVVFSWVFIIVVIWRVDSDEVRGCMWHDVV